MNMSFGNTRNFVAGAALFGSILGGADAAVSTVGFTNITPSTALVAEGAFTLNLISDGITGTASSFNGFVSNTLGSISFTFDQDYDLNSFILWNDVVVNNEGLDDFTLRFFDFSDGLIPVPFTAEYMGPSGQVAPEEYVFASPVAGVRRVELEVMSVQSPSFPTRIEIREVDFGVVPEPSTFVLLGFGSLGFVLRRSRPSA